MKKRFIALGVALTMLFIYGCTAEKEITPTVKKIEVTQTAKGEAPKAVTVTPEPIIAEEPKAEPKVEPNVVTHSARLFVHVDPEPAEEVNYDYAEDVPTGEYHEDVPQADSGTYLGDWTITFYCTGSCCNGSYTGTASGAPLTPWHTCACTALPFGTVVYIEGVGEFVVEDTGVSGNWIDCCVDSHQQALDLGMRTAAVYIVG